MAVPCPDVDPVPPPVPPLPVPPPPVPVPPPPAAPTVAVTTASTEVERVVCAFPLESVLTSDTDSEPPEVEKLTGAALSAFPLTSTTLAVTVEDPPLADIVDGFAESVIRPTAAVPTEILTEPVLVAVVPPLPPVVPAVVAPPDAALIVAVPLFPFPRKVAIARPLTSVVASTGSMIPSVVIKITCVPG